MPISTDRCVNHAVFQQFGWRLFNQFGKKQFLTWRLPKLVVILIASCLLLRSTQAAPAKEIRRVLVFYEAGLSYPGLALIDKEIRAALRKSPYQIEFYSEDLEEVLFPEEASQQEFRNWYIRKYRDRKPDLIIAEGPPSIKFMVDSHNQFFPNTPIVFCGSSEEQADKTKVDSQFAGIWMTWEPAKTFQVALRLQPRTNHVVIVGGVSSYDRHVEAMVRESLRDYEGRFEFTYLTDPKVPTLLERLTRLPKDTIVLYTSFSQDATGTTFIDATQILPIVASAANAPVFVLADTQIGPGPVGGYVSSFAAQGRVAGEIALKILAGARPQDIPIVRGTNVYMFDWRALQRWRFRESDLPPGSIVLNRQPTVWESYKRYIIGVISLFILETLLVLALLWQRTRRRKVEESLVERLTFETLLSDLSTTFLNLPEEQVATNLEESLGRMGALFQLDRITIYEFSQDRTELTVNFAWTRHRTQSALIVMKANQLPWWTDRIVHGKVLVTSDVNSLPDEAFLEKEFLRKRGIVSGASIPLEVGGEVFGAMVFASTTRRVVWSDDFVLRLKMLAEIFSNALGRKHAEERLRESEERFRLVANTAPVLIWMSGTDKRCNYFNQGWLDFTGREVEAELGNGWAEGVHPEDLQQCLETYIEAFDRRERFAIEYRLRNHNGEYRWILDNGVPRFNADGTFAGYIGTAIDVTDRKEAEQTLATVSGRLIEAQEEERHRIARELHDDISQRLALLSVELQGLVGVRHKSSAELRDRTEHLLKRTSQISGDIHALSHRLHSSKLDYMGVVAAIAGFCNEMIVQTGLEIDFEHTDVPRSLPQDISLCLFRILQEGLRNAVKHSGAQHFEVELRGFPGAILLLIRDSGTGFDPEAAMKSSGLGLISMRERVGLVKGTISIASKPMLGTEIRVHIPVAQALAASAAQMSFPGARGMYGTSEDKDLVG